MAAEWGLGKPRVKTTKPACRWCGYRAQAELKPSDPVIGPDLYECADVGHCVIRLRSKAKMVEVFGKDEIPGGFKKIGESDGASVYIGPDGTPPPELVP